MASQRNSKGVLAVRRPTPLAFRLIVVSHANPPCIHTNALGSCVKIGAIFWPLLSHFTALRGGSGRGLGQLPSIPAAVVQWQRFGVAKHNFGYEIWLAESAAKSRIDALEVALHAIEEWQELFAKWGIAPPKTNI